MFADEHESVPQRTIGQDSFFCLIYVVFVVKISLIQGLYIMRQKKSLQCLKILSVDSLLNSFDSDTTESK